MKWRPIIFQPRLVRAIQRCVKTETRRIIRKPERLEGLMHMGEEASWCPYGGPGDGLYVRERWAVGKGYNDHSPSQVPNRTYIKRWFGADWMGETAGDPRYRGGRWRPSIHMPRWLSRIQLVVEAVRAERLQDMDIHAAIAEGMNGGIPRSRVLAKMASTWNQIHGHKAPRGWAHNPWVWVVRFRPAVEFEKRTFWRESA